MADYPGGGSETVTTSEALAETKGTAEAVDETVTTSEALVPYRSTTVQGFSTRSVVFGGTDEYVTMGDVLGFERTDAFSISCWVECPSSASGALVSKADASVARGYQLYVSNGEFGLYLGNTYPTNRLGVKTSSAYTDGNWHHVAATYAGGSSPSDVVLYVDGAAVAMTTVADTLSATISNTSPLLFADQGSFDFPLAGSIDDVSMWDKELSASEVAQIFNNGDGPSDLTTHTAYANLVGWWLMGDGDTFPTVVDHSTGGHNGTMTNMAASAIQADAPSKTVEDVAVSEALVANQDASEAVGETVTTSEALVPYRSTTVQGFSTRSVVFGGTDEYVTMGDVLGFERTDAFSISVWFKTTTTTEGRLWSKATTGHRGYMVSIYSTGKLWIVLSNDWTGLNRIIAETSGGWNDGQWHHLVVTWDGSSGISGLKVYFDDTLDSLTTIANTLSGSILTTEPFNLGATSTTGYLPYVGSLDDVSVWDKELTASEVTLAYNNGSPSDLTTHPAYANLVGWWLMGDGDTYPTLIDRSTGGHNGLMTNMEASDIQAVTSSEMVENVAISEATAQLVNVPRAVSETVTTSEALAETKGTSEAVGETVTTSEALVPYRSTTVQGFSTRSVLFDGVNEYVTMGDVLGFEWTDAFSVSFWIRGDIGFGGYVVSKMDGAGPTGYGIASDSDNLTVYIQDTPTYQIQVDTAISYQDGLWHHGVVTYDGSGNASGVIIYIDGAVAASSIIDSTLASHSIVTTASFNIGGRTDGVALYEGKIDDVSVWDKELSASEVAQIYNNGDGPSDLTTHPAYVNLVGWWLMGDGDTFPTVVDHSSTDRWPILPDFSGNHYDGTASNITGAQDVAPGSQALVFGGTNEYVTMGNVLGFAVTDTFSISLWFKTTQDATSYLVVKRDDSTPIRGYYVALLESTLVGATGVVRVGFIEDLSNNFALDTSPGLNDGQWHYLVATYDGSALSSGISIYIDGALDTGTSPTDLGSTTTIANTVSFYLGGRSTGGCIVGSIADVAVWDKELSAVEATEIYNDTVPINLKNVSCAANLAAWWRCGDAFQLGTDGVRDFSGNGLHGTATNMEITDVESRVSVGKSLLFDGVEEKVTVGDVLGIDHNTAASISLWLKWNNTDDSRCVLAKVGAVGGGYQIFTTINRQIIFYLVNTYPGNALALITNAYYGYGAWHHYVVTLDGSGTAAGTTVYVDGVPVATTTIFNTLSASTLNSYNLCFGGRDLDDLWFEGSLDEVSFWDKELSALEVADVYNSGIPTDLTGSANLVGYWPLGDATPYNGLMTNMEASDIQADTSSEMVEDVTVSEVLTPSRGTAVQGFSTRSVLFDGVNEYVTMGDVLGTLVDRTTPFSISLWLKTTQTPGDPGAMIARQNESSLPSGWDLETNGTRLTLNLVHTWASNCLAVYSYPEVPMNDGNWHHGVVTFDGSGAPSGVTFYIDGNLMSTGVNYNNLVSSIYMAGTSLTLGRRDISTSYLYFAGSLDEVSLWNRELTSGEVAEIWNGGHPADLALHAAYANLAAWWRMGENSSFPIIPDMGDGTVSYPGTMMNMEVADIQADAPSEMVENVVVSEAFTVGRGQPVALLENVAVSEAVTVDQIQPIALPETVVMSESAATLQAHLAGVSETVVASEAVSLGSNYETGVSETVPVSEFLVTSEDEDRFIFEPVGVSEVLGVSHSQSLDVSDTISVTEVVFAGNAYNLDVADSVSATESVGLAQAQSSNVSEIVLVSEVVVPSWTETLPGTPTTQFFRIALTEELSWSPRGATASIPSLKVVSTDGGVTPRILRTSREYTTFQTGYSGHFVYSSGNGTFTSNVFNFPGDLASMPYDPVGNYLEISSGGNQGIYKITGINSPGPTTTPILLELERSLPLSDPLNGYVQGTLEYVSRTIEESHTIYVFRLNNPRVTETDPIVEIFELDRRDGHLPPYSTWKLGSSYNTIEITTPNIFPEVGPPWPWPWDYETAILFVVARVSPKVDWRIISGITHFLIETSKVTAGKTYEISAASLRTTGGGYVDFVGYTLVPFSAVWSPRVVWAGPTGDEGMVLVQYDQPMQPDVDNLFNPGDYHITGGTTVQVSQVRALDDTTVALTTTGLSSGDYTLTVSSSTPKDVAGNPLDPTFNTAVFTSSAPLAARSIFTDRGPIAKPPLVLQSGSSATFDSFTEVTLTGASLTSSHVGKYLTLTGSSTNAGTYRVSSVLSSTKVKLQASFTLPDATSPSWELFDPRNGLIADDPSDVTVTINGSVVTPESVVGLLGQIVLNSAPGASDDVKVDYSWCCNPTVEVRRLNSKEFRLNAWNRDQGCPHDVNQHKYRYNNVLVKPSDYDALDTRAPLAQPQKREVHYRAYERAYTPVLNDPNLLVLNTPIHRIAYPPAQRQLSEEFVSYNGLALPEDLTVNPWTRRGSGTASASSGYLTIEDDTSGPFPTGHPLFWTRNIDVTFPHVFAMSWRFQPDVLTELDGVFSGIAAGYSDDIVACVVGFLDDGGTKKIGVLKRGYGDDPSLLSAWTGGLDFTSTATDLPADFDWSDDLHSYRIFRDRDGIISIYLDGDTDPTLRVLADELPYLEELNAPFDEIQGAFFGSLSRPARSISTWDFVRYLIQPTNPVQTSASSFVSYEANVVPETDVKPWTLVGFHGTATILSTDFLLLDATSASDAPGVGVIGGDYRGYFRFEPLLSYSSELVVDAKLQGVTQTHSLEPNALMFAVDDGTRLMQVSFLTDTGSPTISYGGRSLPEEFSPYIWSSDGSQTAEMVGRILRITDTSTSDGLVYYYDDTVPSTSDDRVVASTTDYILEFRCRVRSYTTDVSGFAGAFGHVFDGIRAVGLLLQEVGGTKYVSFQSDGVVVGQVTFDWGDGEFHTYRLTKSTSGNLVTLFIDGEFVDTLPYSSFAAPGAAPSGQVSFGSSTPASMAAESVVDWAYCNAWRIQPDCRYYVGLWKGTTTGTLRDYHLPVKESGRDATALANALGDPYATFISSNVVAGDLLIVDEGPNTGVYEVQSVTSETELALTTAWPQQPSKVTYRIAEEADWTSQHQWRLTRDAQGTVSVLRDAESAPLIRVGYTSLDLPLTGVNGIRTFTGGLPAIVFGTFESTTLSQSSWDFVRYGLTRSPNELRIVPHHQVLNQWNVMASPERLYTTLAHDLTDYRSSSTGQPPKKDPDFLENSGLTAFTLLNEGTPIVPLTQSFEIRAPYPTTEFIGALNRPEDVLNNDADFTINDGSIRYKLVVPKDVLYSSLDLIEQTAGEESLIAPFSDGCGACGINGLKLEYTKEVCLNYDGDVLPEDDVAAPTPWSLVSEDPVDVSTSVFGGTLTFSTGTAGTKTAYLNNTPLPDAPSLRTEAQFRMRVLNDGTLGTDDTQIRAGLSAPGLTVALAFVTTPLAERYILVIDLNNGNVVGSITFDFLDGNYHTYHLVRDPGAGVVQVSIS